MDKSINPFDWPTFLNHIQNHTLTPADATAAHSAIDAAFARSLKVQEYYRKSIMHRERMAELAAETAPTPPPWLSGVAAAQPIGDKDYGSL